MLLVVPAIFKAHQERKIRLEALSPLLGLGAWAFLYGRLASPERTPTEWIGWLQDLWDCTRIMALEQGRFVLLLGLIFAWNRTRARPRDLCLSFVVIWLLFFSWIGFLGGRGTAETLTHVRYFLPGMAVLAVVSTARWPWLALLGLYWIQIRSPYGPEASTFGVDVARAEAEAAPWIAAQSAAGRTVWVGSYTAAGLTQPWAGIVDEPLTEFQVYTADTTAQHIRVGALLIESAYGEPAAFIKNGLEVEEVHRWERGDAWVIAWQVNDHGRYGVGGPLD